jgi:flagellar protein FliT
MQQTLIDFYRAIEATSLQMLEAAKSENWDDVVRLEGACAVLIEQLRFRSRSEELEPQERAEKTRIMQRILHNYAQIRYLAEPWLVHFEKKFDNLQQLLH